ncbi:MAG TPA: phosphatase domain-containing protein [Lysobacter sp.]|nr:phosphatase domain-containing protein [Lysobacter sp.]
MTDASEPQSPAFVRRHLQSAVIRADDYLDAARGGFRRLFGTNRPRHIAAYRGWGDAQGVQMIGRVLAEVPQGGPGEADDWWDNLVNTYRRFESDEVPGAPVTVRFGEHVVEATADHEGYYQAALPGPAVVESLWHDATASLADGTLATPQPVLLVHPQAAIGVISDIDDTILHSGITNWKTAAQLTFLHNARTRKPLKGVAKLYQALQAGADGLGRVPVFYVSSSPWNLYDLLHDFMRINAIPPGPIFLRDLGTDAGKFLKTRGHGHKLERARELIARFPSLRWVLLGDSGQADAELYAQAAEEFGERIAAIYIRDVDPDIDSPLDAAVDAHIERIGPGRVPMLRAKDSRAIAEHAAGLGLIEAKWAIEVAREVARDEARPSVAQAVTEAASQGTSATDASVPPEDAGRDAVGPTPPVG